MKRIDRLLHIARGKGKWHMMAFVNDCGDGYFKAHYSFWDGVPRSGEKYPGSSMHNTADEALDAIEQAVQAFPFPVATQYIIVDDFGDLED